MTKQICATVDEDVYKAMRRYANANAISVSALITKLLREYLRKNGIEVR